MCVIFVCTKHRPTDDMVARGFDANPSGAGIAWREPSQEKDEGIEVRWEKGLDLKEIQRLCREMPLPYIAHFRIPSCGGAHAQLCHPFPVTKDVELFTSGKTFGNVLFHNGHWTRWKDTLLEAVVRQNITLPSGRWSDTRGMALMAATFGPGILEIIDEKYALLGPEVLDVGGPGWSKIKMGNSEDGPFILASNTHWQNRTVRYPHNDENEAAYGYAHGYGTQYTMCREVGCTKTRDKDSLWCADCKKKKDDELEATAKARIDAALARGEKKGGGEKGALETFSGRDESAPTGEAQQPQAQGGKVGLPGSDEERAARSSADREIGFRRNGRKGSDDHALALVSPPKEEDLRITRWVRGLNPSAFRRPLAGDDVRKRQAAKGIQVLGPM